MDGESGTTAGTVVSGGSPCNSSAGGYRAQCPGDELAPGLLAGAVCLPVLLVALGAGASYLWRRWGDGVGSGSARERPVSPETGREDVDELPTYEQAKDVSLFPVFVVDMAAWDNKAVVVDDELPPYDPAWRSAGT